MLRVGLLNFKGIRNALRLVKRLSDVIYYIQFSSKHRKKIVHADRLAIFRERVNKFWGKEKLACGFWQMKRNLKGMTECRFQTISPTVFDRGFPWAKGECRGEDWDVLENDESTGDTAPSFEEGTWERQVGTFGVESNTDELQYCWDQEGVEETWTNSEEQQSLLNCRDDNLWEWEQCCARTFGGQGGCPHAFRSDFGGSER